MLCLSKYQSPNVLRASIFRQVCGALLRVEYFSGFFDPCNIFFEILPLIVNQFVSDMADLQPSKVLKVVRTIDPSKRSELIGVDHVTTNRNWVMAVFVYTGRFLLHLTSKCADPVM